MKRKIISTIISMASVFALTAGSAFAWTYGLTGHGECQADGSFKITWTVSNDENEDLNITASSNTALVPVGTQVTKHTNQNFTQNVSGATAANFTLSLTGNFPSDQTLREKHATVYLREACQQPPTITVTKTTVPAGSTASFSITISSSDKGQVYGSATASISDGGSVTFKVSPGATYNITEAALDGWVQTSNTCQDLKIDSISQTYSRYSEQDHTTVPQSKTCAIVNTQGGRGGGGGSTTVTPAASTTVTPTGAVNAGEGTMVVSGASFAGLLASVGALGFGVRRFAKNQ